MGKGNLSDVPAEELKRELKRRALQAEAEEFKRTATAAGDTMQRFLRAAPEEQKVLRGELDQLLYRVAYKVRKFQAFAKGRKARKG